MLKILLTGASGGLGSRLFAAWTQQYEVCGLAYENPSEDQLSLDLTQPEPIATLVKQRQPDAIVHTVALTNVDRCERDIGLAVKLNTLSTLHVRQAAEAVGCKVIFVSTNDVFDGRRGHYRETDVPAPVNFYAHTKLMAENMLYGYEHSLILRLTFMSWTASGKVPFVRWVADSLRQQKSISLATDQYSSPLFVDTLAAWIPQLFEATGLYHLGGTSVSRYELGMRVARELRLDETLIQPVKAADLPFVAPRPLNVSLNTQKVQQHYGLHSDFDREVQQLLSQK